MYNVSERMKEERASQLQWENDIRVRCKLRICVVFSVVAGYELCVRGTVSYKNTYAKRLHTDRRRQHN